MQPRMRDLFQGLEDDHRLRQAERRRLLRIHKHRGMPLPVRWGLEIGLMAGLYLLGYAGAASYWATLHTMWDPRWVQIFAPLGHAIPALIVGAYVGVLFRRGRYFFLMGPVVLVVATFVREVYLPFGGAEALTMPPWMYWAACAEGITSGAAAMTLGAWLGGRTGDPGGLV